MSETNPCHNRAQCVIHSFLLCFILPDAQDVLIRVIHPDPEVQKFPCPGQSVVYECRTLVGCLALSWKVGDVDLEFIHTNMNGLTINSSDNNFTATLIAVSPAMMNRFFFISTLQVQPSLTNINGSNLTCSAGGVGDPPENSTTITFSGK